ncbi:MAG: amidohydrolase family protein [Proteobacteria bacterium]|nr:amidohydrolase family protein [Pseudomonadota bacterium]
MNSNGKTGISTFIFLLMVAAALAAWMTYGALESVLGILSFMLVGLLCLYPWVIPPVIGIVLAILDLTGIMGPGMYSFVLETARVESSWMTQTWFWVVSVFGILINLFVTVRIYSAIKNLKYRAKPSKKNLALVNCHIIDGNRDSQIIPDGVILIENEVEEGETSGLIVGVGKADETEIPTDFEKMDLQGSYVLPGLINAHCHMAGSGKPMKLMNLSDDMKDKVVGLFRFGFMRRFFKRVMIANANNALNSGVTTIRSMGDPEYLDVQIRKEIEEGKIAGPRILCSGKALSPTGGHGGLIGMVADDQGEIRKGIRKNLREEVDVIKIMSTGGVMDARMIGEAGRPQMTIEEIETACYEAHRGGVMVATHCESTVGIEEALLGGVDTIEHGAEIPDELVDAFKNNPKSLRGYTCLVPTLAAGMGLAVLPIEDTKITPIKQENAILVQTGMIQGLRKAYRSGIKFGMGTDAAVPYSTHYEVWKELKYYLKYTDMTPEEAIYRGTKNTAEVLGIDQITGSIEVGKSADLQVVPGNPLENIDNLGKVSKVIVFGNPIEKPRIKRLRKERTIVPIEV